MNKEIKEQLLTPEENIKYTEDLLIIINGLDFDFKDMKVKADISEKTNRHTIQVIGTAKNPEKPNIVTYTKSHKKIFDYTIATLKSGNTINFSTKTSSINNQKNIDYFKGYIKIPNEGIYIFTLSKENNLTIKYYDYLYFYEQLESKPNLFLYLNNLTFHNIDIEPTITSTLEIDINSCPLNTLNYLFRNKQIIIDTIQNTENDSKTR